MSKTVGTSPSNLPSLQEKYEATVVSLVSRITNALQKKSAGNNAEYNKLLKSFNETCSKPNILGVWFTALSQCANLVTQSGEEIMVTMMQYNFEEITINQPYFEFLVNVASVNPIWTDQVSNKLISAFMTPNSIFSSYEQRELYFNDIHKTISKIMSPSSSNLLFQNIVKLFPDKSHSLETLELFLMNLLFLVKEYPLLREKVVSLILEKLVMFDLEIDEKEEDEDDCGGMVFSLESSHSDTIVGVSQKDLIEKLDMMLYQILSFIERNPEISNNIFDISMNIFDRLFLPAPSKYLQFIYFFMCSKFPQYTDQFLKHLFQKIPRTDQLSLKSSNPHLIENSILYVGSFIARMKELSISTLANCCYSLSNWAVAYINHFPVAYPDFTHHRLFYHISHCLLYILCFKFNKVMDSSACEEILSELNTIVTCKLNPLKILPEAVVSEFTSTLSTLEHKKIKELEKTCRSTIYNNKLKQKNKALSPLLKPINYQEKAFGNIRYPFDPLKLPRSLQFIEMFYNSWEGESSDEEDEDEEDDSNSNSSSSFKHSTSFSDDDIVMSYTPVETTFDIDFFSHSPINYGRFHK